jgi:hypothetical protein
MRILIVSSVLLLAAACCYADIITVDDDGPADFNNIQDAINNAANGDTVIVADGLYSGMGNKYINFNGKAITVKSENGPENCIVDCNYYGGGFYFENNENADSIIDGFTVINADKPCREGEECPITWDGGGLYCDQSSPTIRNCIIRNCD